MPEYTLRNVDPELWSRFTERANREGWAIRPLIAALLEEYAAGRVMLAKPAPKQLPEWAWLRAHYRAVVEAAGLDFQHLTSAQRWERLTDHVVRSPAGNSWTTLAGVPADQRLAILHWLEATAAHETRHLLTLRAIAHIGEGADLQKNRRAFQYEVLGLPGSQQAWIADFNGGWRILRVIDGKQDKEWSGPHLTKEEALDTLAETIDTAENTA